ncbi:hypothetical protein PIB30_063590 [Stylosanthes scabra]|uniref:Uncharacterized protein n=1 Tax=Stylosanthes scabra TaxID=79078 RepID=A0ABU6QL91_9FABA|nr:hypothetical protein [Stylosanthes scabra]
MPKSAIGGRRRRGDRGGRGRGDGAAGVDGGSDRAEAGPTGEHVGEASGSAVPQTPGSSTQGYVDDTLHDFGSPSASFFDDVRSPASMEQQFGQEGSYYADLARCLQESPQDTLRPATDQVHATLPVDLNESAFEPLGYFSFALGGTPPSAFVDVHPQVDPVIPAEEGHEEPTPEPCRGCRVPRRQGCGTGGHM